MAVDLDIENVDVSEAFEQHGLAFHYWFTGQCANISQTEHGGAVGDHRHQVGAAGVFESILRVVVDRQARLRNARRVSHAQIPLRTAGFCGRDLNLSRTPAGMVIERLLLCDRHNVSSI